MKKNLLAFLFAITSFVLQAQVSGIVYKDYNTSGTRENITAIPSFVEPLVQGITVKAYSATDVLLATTNTDAAGAYSFTGLTLPVRVEFSNLPAGYLPSNATNQTSITGSNVQFYTAASTTADFRINSPSDFCQANFPQVTHPYSAVAKNYIGLANLSAEHALVGNDLNQATITTPNFTSGGNTPVDLARNNGVGNTWGVAYSRSNRIVYTSAVVRHYFDYGSGGFDAIYGTLNSTTTPPIATNNTVYTIDLSTLGVTMGTDPRNTAMTFSSPYYNDHNTYLGVGKAGIGDIDVSADGDTLYAVNMLAGAPTLVVINISNPLSPVLISNNPIVGPTCTNGTFRPWALSVYEGTVYVGGVCDGATGGTADNVTATVLKWNGGSSYTSVLNTDMNYIRSFATIRANQGDTTNCDWGPWNDSWSLRTRLLTSPNLASSPQPMLTDIEFVEDGSMVLAFADRFSFQSALDQRAYNVTSGSTIYSPVAAGDILKFCKIAGAFVKEGGAGCTQTHTDMGSTLTTTGNNIPDIAEFFFDDYFNPGNTSGNQGHSETTLGSLAIIPGTNRLLATSIDPMSAANESLISSTTAPFNTNGVRVFTTSNGNLEKAWVLSASGSTNENAKGGQMGDIEVLCDAAPIEIGNRVWNDVNANGIQDPGEATFANVTVELYLDANMDGVPDGAALATVTTDANGEYIFSNQITGEYVSGDPGFGHAKFNIAGLVDKQKYLIRIGAADWNSGTGTGAGDLAGLVLTQSNIPSNGITDASDNDATLSSGFAQIMVTTGVIGDNNHSYDFGFTTLQALPVQLLHFNAIPSNNNVALSWNVVGETNLANYEIQHSTTGRNFTTINTTTATSTTNYSTIHTTPIKGINYYRLKMNDQSGDFKYSDIRKVDFAKGIAVNIFPNPVSKLLNVNIASTNVNSSTTITLIATNGAVVYKRKSATVNATQTIDVSNFAPGKYILQINTNNKIIYEKVDIL